MEKIKLKLYIIDETARSRLAIEQLRNIMEKNFKEMYNLEIINLLENPDLAEKDKIMAVPTVMRELPPPIQKIVGDLSDEKKVLVGLNLIFPE